MMMIYIKLLNIVFGLVLLKITKYSLKLISRLYNNNRKFIYSFQWLRVASSVLWPRW